ncbi:MAG: sulfurtransferase, partial [Thermomicrobiales bacterium]
MTYPGPIVDVAWLREHAEESDVRIIDARPLDQYLAGSFPGASHLDTNQIRLGASSPEAIERFIAAGGAAARQAGLNGGETVVFVEEFSGTLAARGVWLLDAIGHGGGTMLDGGLRAWLEEEGEITRPSEDPTPGTFQESLNRQVVSTAEDLLAGGEDGSISIIDTRADQEWLGGIVPTAQHCEWVRNLESDGTFRPLNELKDLYAELGISNQRPVTAYCGSGFRAAHTYVVLKALGYNVANYAPSWGEWGRRSDLPITPPTR